jgi:DNA adenine methylase
MKPFCKWAGGKSKLVPQILELFPRRFGNYYEPFVGGGAVFWALDPDRYVGATLADTNAELMTTYRVVRDNVDELVRILGNMQKKHTKDFYMHVRSKAPTTSVAMAARMLYLNATCFNGLYRVNKQGQFNVPIGDYESPAICKEDVLRECSLGLRRTGRGAAPCGLGIGDFEAVLEDADEGDVAYMDPPYLPLSKTSSFTAYGSDGFGVLEHTRLARVFKSLVERRVFVVLSNSDTPLTRELYHGYEMHEIQAARSINSKGAQRGKIGELLIVGRKAKAP